MCLLLLITASFTHAQSATTVKNRMVGDLDFIRNVFEVKYAPSAWKKELFAWDLDKEWEKARAVLLAKEAPTTEDFRYILKRFFASAHDYHVGIHFYSTESATLPFFLKGTKSGYFIAYVDPAWQSTLSEGDEVISFGGRPVDQVIQDLMKNEIGGTSATDKALAEFILTYRNASSGDKVPQGDVVVEVKRKGVQKSEQITLRWHYSAESIKDVAQIGKSVALNVTKCFPASSKHASELSFLNKMMVHPQWKHWQRLAKEGNPHVLGAHTSFLPLLGRKMWESDEESPFDAYIFKMPLGHQSAGQYVGYVRIPHYMGDTLEAEKFAEIIAFLEEQTDMLVVDQVNNPGGSVFYLYALASMLTDRPLETPKHHLLLTQEEVYLAYALLALVQDVRDDAGVKEALGESIGGYPIDYAFVLKLKQFCAVLIEEWEEGHHFTKPTFLFGFDDIKPHPVVRYTKPILLLINNLDFSGGDFFPAILQDNKRATILGTKTAGAGGYVIATHFPNQSGIAAFTVTGSFAMRKDKSPLENLGVTADIQYELTQNDLQSGYSDYKGKILKTVDAMLVRS